MEQNPTIKIRKEDKAVWDEFLERTRSEGTETFHQFMGELRLLLDLMSPNRKLLFTFDMNHHGTNKWVILRLSDANSFGLDAIPPELRADVLKAFGYDEQFHDLREKPTTEQPQPAPQRKLTFTEQIQAKHDAEVEWEKKENGE